MLAGLRFGTKGIVRPGGRPRPLPRPLTTTGVVVAAGVKVTELFTAIGVVIVPWVVLVTVVVTPAVEGVFFNSPGVTTR